MRSILKWLIPQEVWTKFGLMRREWISRNDNKKTPQEVFSRIYANNLWGRGEGSSGVGSSFSFIVSPYIEAIKQWADQYHGAELTAVDLGCGNFQVGGKIYQIFKHYIALDIVPALIEQHKENTAYKAVEFKCVNAIDEDLPVGDVIFVRQVLQHLSNEQILQILPKLQKFPHAIISEHLPHPSAFHGKNADKVHGGGIRIKQGSGVYLEAPPFSLKCVESDVILTVPAGPEPEHDGYIQTTWYRFK